MHAPSSRRRGIAPLLLLGLAVAGLGAVYFLHDQFGLGASPQPVYYSVDSTDTVGAYDYDYDSSYAYAPESSEEAP